MTYSEIREKFVDFFKAKGHRLVPSASLIPMHDASVLLTVAGMQQFKPYFTGEPSPYGDRAISIQKCFRTSDIDEVGDDSHLTFFEMFGNFAFNGSVSKDEAIQWAWEFLTSPNHMGIQASRLSATYYDGSRVGTRADMTAQEILATLIGLTDISAQGEDNFWGPTGGEGPCGPTVEFYIDGVEVWNIVFNEYYCSVEKELTPLSSGLGIDTGMGLERLLTAVTEEAGNMYETDAFLPIIEAIHKHVPEVGAEINRSMKIIADHLRGSVFLLSDHVRPSNKEQGYILRRLLRRAILHLDKLRVLPAFDELLEVIITKYGDFYPELLTEKDMILQLANLEKDKFLKTMVEGKKELDKLLASHGNKSSGEDAFNLFATYGLPLDFIKEETSVNEDEFNKKFQQHQDISRAGVKSKFGGHGLSSGATVSSADRQKITRFHTAAHLLHAALIKFLGNEIKQAGSDLSVERLRFDFTFPRALSPEEKTLVEDWVNKQIESNLPVKHETIKLTDALASGAVAFFKEKYPDEVEMYTILSPDNSEVVSKEICGGPHVTKTGEIGKFKIVKEQSSSAGVRRIKATID
ncbi:alanine--tRNA ligase [Patescibacteria group bacterium]|nr:alanine--tRNA ligase [Patescibacteria group bacterium]